MFRIFFYVFLLIHSYSPAVYYSQCKQDQYINESFFKGKDSGVFVDIGAHNGISLSNSYFFEKELGWNGVCIEPMPEVYSELKKNRSCLCIQGCVSDRNYQGRFLRINSSIGIDMLSGLIDLYDPRHLDRIERELKQSGGSYEVINVNCYRLNDILNACKIRCIDFLSIDTEGSEFEIISSIDFSTYHIDVIALEDNYNDPRFVSFLRSKGFALVKKLEQDLIFVNTNFRCFKSHRVFALYIMGCLPLGYPR